MVTIPKQDISELEVKEAFYKRLKLFNELVVVEQEVNELKTKLSKLTKDSTPYIDCMEELKKKALNADHITQDYFRATWKIDEMMTLVNVEKNRNMNKCVTIGN